MKYANKTFYDFPLGHISFSPHRSCSARCSHQRNSGKVVGWSEPDRESTDRKDWGRMAKEGGAGSRRARELTYNTAYPPWLSLGASRPIVFVYLCVGIVEAKWACWQISPKNYTTLRLILVKDLATIQTHELGLILFQLWIPWSNTDNQTGIYRKILIPPNIWSYTLNFHGYSS
jgi:hypothetical protein